MGLVIVINSGKHGSVDIDLPESGRMVEMAVRRSTTSAAGIGKEVVTQVVKVRRPASITLAPGERSKPLDDRIVSDPVFASRVREGVLGVQPYVQRARPAPSTPSTPPVVATEKGKDKDKGKGGKDRD